MSEQVEETRRPKPIIIRREMRAIVKTLESHTDEEIQARADSLRAMGDMDERIAEILESIVDLRNRAKQLQRPWDKTSGRD